jgi:hypothetical protein
VRLCAQVPGTEFLSNPIKVLITDVETKISAKKVAVEEKETCYDIIGFRDAMMDNAIRTIASRAKDYDLNTPGSNAYRTIFPENTTDIINLNPAEEVSEVSKVVTRIKSLGETHPIYPLITTLTESAAQVDIAIKAHLDAITAVGAADAQLQLAKTALIRQYLSNMFDAEKRFGRKTADRLFPRIINSKNDDSDDETNN